MRILKIESLPKINVRWIDRDMIVLHSCFQILKDVVERENFLEVTPKKYNKDLWNEVEFLYNWWKERINVSNNLFQDEEDDEMLLRLMKIRKSLWT
jgi:hypothetical protein